MRILLLGAGGFIGSALARALIADGHSLRAVGRNLDHGRSLLPDAEWLFCDLRRMRNARDWLPFVEGVDAVINASGALQSGLRDDVRRVQQQAILALIEASLGAQRPHVIQISAPEAERQASDFMQSKARADAALVSSGLAYTIIRPGLVIGRNCFGGTEMIRAAAGLPAGVEIGGTGPIQSVALVDVVDAVRSALADPGAVTGSFDLVEAQPRSLGEIIALHRAWLSIPPPRVTLRVLVKLLRPVTLFADALGWFGWRSPLRSNALEALVCGVRGNADHAAALLGRTPTPLPETLARMGAAGKADRWHARIAPLFPLCLAALFVLWLAGGVFGLMRPDQAAALLTAGGVDLLAARLAVILGSVADLAIALGLLFRPTAKAALGAGAALAAAYAIGAAFVRPDLWLDPLGPMVKLLPLVAMMLLCRALLEER